MSAVLFSAVSFDSISGFYTYSYALQNDTSSTVFGLYLEAGSGGVADVPAPAWPIYTAPPGWALYDSMVHTLSVSTGGFYEWYGPTALIQPWSITVQFSVTTPFAPTLDGGLTNYFVLGHDGLLGSGNIVVPDGTPPPTFYHINGVPELSTWAMLLLGFFLLVVFRRKLAIH